MNQPIRILIVDDHPLLQEGIVMVVEHEPDMQVVGSAATGRESIALCERLQPNLVLMDLRLPDISGIDAMIAIRAKWPTVKVILLTTFAGDAEVNRALKAGAAGYLLKTMPRKQIVESIRQIHAGRRRIDPGVAANLAEHMGLETLSQREVEILKQVAEGNRNKEIAHQFALSEETIKSHMKNILEKLGASDRTQAVSIAVRRGIMQL
ncbi:response regulator transcription factor [Acidipila sp. EB88]|uniref:response regulator n=1 Tax=Acidipila sp. EB88 TaxID=2305226 RepID=UPI000F5E1402|nr:response regulator transcription factor [Acidipila sp. EB88]RRA48821.1 DNA-binding response regulator [Acidipila sp. EB88]